ncbi:MAG TPA: tetratricopeptide repeat protein [Gemmataceae bacterium]|nr:tetratricopeptide repeat protein [Gemmataceae bacterium]
MASARTLVEFMQAGISLNRLRRSVQQLQGWLGNVDQPLLQLAALERNGELLVRLEDGLADPSGQRCFDFESHTEPAVELPESRPSAEQLFDQACAFEDAGHLEEAIKAYRQALLAGGAGATTCYNLANALYAFGQVEAAIERYYQTVELKPDFAEAWNNLGVALSESGRRDESRIAFEHAVSANPPFIEANYNLADLLDEAGEVVKARKHWLAYLSLSAPGPRQNYASRRADGL